MIVKAKDRIVQEALAVPQKDRAAIVAKLWGKESDRRFEASKRGKIESVSNEEVLRSLNRN